MTVEIRTTTMEPVRQTFSHLVRRFGDKPASRYQEATYDVQATTNFHYRPLWQPDKELNDASRTAIQMEDWYSLKDPRQFYYGAYVQQRAKMQEQAENNYGFFEKRDLARHLTDEVKSSLIHDLIPLRHVEHTANLNNIYGSAYGYGTAVTQALLYNGMDRLGIAQYLSRIGLILDGNSGDSLAEAKNAWMNDTRWQELRSLCEHTLLIEDWFELFLVQDLVMDTLMQELFYVQYDQWLTAEGAQDIGMLTEFMRDWNKDVTRWADSVFKTVATESDTNRVQLQSWFEQWRGKAAEAFASLADSIGNGSTSLEAAMSALDKRATKIGLARKGD